MNPDFTLIWPLSCLKDGDHLCSRYTTDRLHNTAHPAEPVGATKSRLGI